MSLDWLTEDLRAFAAARGWEKFHRPKNLAMALSGEVGELVAELQWLTPEECENLTDAKREAVAAEMADVLMYLTRLADVLGVDLEAATRAKMARNAGRFPELAEGGEASVVPVER
ncbi:nucleotide pyrophosphohydrolase [Phytomonospora sp. NPDC050363]|uniref:nucleotide pyrophosphohydrolase n=1 Tax=Phytomonospora sp. NPDC050363 TaxID=3155642 RepID=UPI0033D047BE